MEDGGLVFNLKSEENIVTGCRENGCTPWSWTIKWDGDMTLER